MSELTQAVADEIGAIARALPYRESVGVDRDRVYWVEVPGQQRVGVAYAPDTPGGPAWMIAFDTRVAGRVSRGEIRAVVELFAGRSARWEDAPIADVAPYLTMIRVRAI
ncbi:MAG TPA: hypothetical protein PLR44_05465 [Thermomicrobiales bacterium]|nr:hypothetical protein [Thermomicrobiales bacterium]